MVSHATLYYRDHAALDPPPAVLHATAEYRADQDTIGQFFAAEVTADDDGELRASELYLKFKAWWEAEGHPLNRIPGRTRFGTESKRKFAWERRSAGMIYRARLISDPVSAM